MKTKTTIGLTILAVAALVSPASAASSTTPVKTDTTTTGSGAKYTTEVSRSTTGELSEMDLRQASLLTSQMLEHVGAAIEQLNDDDTTAAKAELKDAQTLIGIVRDLLPTTHVKTVVHDSHGAVVYRHSQAVQDDVIELFNEVATIDVLDHVLDEKKASSDEPEYLGSVELYTSVFADLGFIERKIDAAMGALDQPDEARDQLVLAELNGVDMRISEAESPLLEARRALELAEEQVADGAFTVAKENLYLAKLKLKEYQTLFSPTDAASVKEITDQIDTVTKDVEKDGVTGAIRSCWNKTVKLFDHDQPKVAKSTDTPPAK